jgi:hypothetical protein
MPDALVTRVELGRLPFKRRPIAEPGTRLVFQLANGALVCPDHPYTSGETWFRGPKAAYVVDTGVHDASFETELPSAAPAVYFTATISYRWQVHDPARVVRDGVTDPSAESRAHLEHWLPTITCAFPPDQTLQATHAVQGRMGHAPIDLERGIRIGNLHVALRMDADQAVLAKELEIGRLRHEIALRDARGQGEIDTIKREQYQNVIASGPYGVMTDILAKDPSKGPEVLSTMINLSEREQQRTLEAIKVLIDGGEVRLGELDGAVRGAVQRLSTMMGVATEPVGQLGGGVATDPGRALPEQPEDGQDDAR